MVGSWRRLKWRGYRRENAAPSAARGRSGLALEVWGQSQGPRLGDEIRGETLQQTLDLLLAQLDLVVQLALLDEERRLHFHEMLVVLELLLGEVVGQDVQHHTLPAVQVLLELPGILVLSGQDLPLLTQRALPGRSKWVSRGRGGGGKLSAETPFPGLGNVRVSMSVAALESGDFENRFNTFCCMQTDLNLSGHPAALGDRTINWLG